MLFTYPSFLNCYHANSNFAGYCRYTAAGGEGRPVTNHEEGEVFEDEAPKRSRHSSPSAYAPARRHREYSRDPHDRYPEDEPRYRDDRYRGPSYLPPSHYPPSYDAARHSTYPRWRHRSPSVSSVESRYRSRSRSRSRSLGRDYTDRMRGLHMWERERSRDRNRERQWERERERERGGVDPRMRDYRPSRPVDDRRGRVRTCKAVVIHASLRNSTNSILAGTKTSKSRTTAMFDHIKK